MRGWFLTTGFIVVTSISFVIFLGFLAFFSVARINLKGLIDSMYPEVPPLLRSDKDRVKNKLRRKLFSD